MFALLFAAGAIALLATINASVGQYASHATDAALVDESRLLRSEAQASGSAALARLILERQRVVHGRQYLYLLLDPFGRRIAGTLPPAVGGIGWGQIDMPELPQPDDPSDEKDTFRTYGVRLGGGALLVVGRDISDLNDLANWLRLVTLWSALGITLLALGGGLVVAHVVLHRMDRVNTALGRVREGDLDARVPAIGMGDEFNRLTESINLMLGRMQASIEGLRQVSTDIAHDLRTPLGRLRQHLDTLREDNRPETLGSAVDEAVAQVDEVLATFHALLRIGQIEAGIGRSRFESVDLSTLMERVHLAYEHAAEDAGKTLSAGIAPGVAVEGDPRLLTQLFANLIENALRHTGGRARISFRLSEADGVVSAVVADNGPGIPAGERGKVIRRFYRLDASRGTAGSGLGLSLVAAIADLHRAELELSDNHPGLAAEIRFPTAGPKLARPPPGP
jgi:signal transduction histidine kinase